MAWPQLEQHGVLAAAAFIFVGSICMGLL